MPRDPVRIDRDKLRAAVRKLRNEYVYYMLDDAIEMLPLSKLHKIAKKYIDLKGIRPEADGPTKPSLLAVVQLFEKESLSRNYFQSFEVNSRNCTKQSTGTSAWIAQCLRLFDRCIVDSRKGAPAEVCKAVDILFGLLSRIDDNPDDIIFFADEGGCWQVGVDWPRVLPAWFKVLSATTEPEEFVTRITTLLSRHYRHDRDKMLTAARRTATPQQREALAKFAVGQAPKSTLGGRPIRRHTDT